MLKTLKIFTGLLYFFLPVSVAFIKFMMFMYLVQAFRSGVVGVLYGLGGLLAGIYLIFSAGFADGTRNRVLTLISLIIMLIPVGFTLYRSYEMMSTLSWGVYILLIVCVVITFFLVLKTPAHSETVV